MWIQLKLRTQPQVLNSRGLHLLAKRLRRPKRPRAQSQIQFCSFVRMPAFFLSVNYGCWNELNHTCPSRLRRHNWSGLRFPYDCWIQVWSDVFRWWILHVGVVIQLVYYLYYVYMDIVWECKVCKRQIIFLVDSLSSLSSVCFWLLYSPHQHSSFTFIP